MHLPSFGNCPFPKFVVWHRRQYLGSGCAGDWERRWRLVDADATGMVDAASDTVAAGAAGLIGAAADAEGISGGSGTCASTAAVASTDAIGAGAAGPVIVAAGGGGISGWPGVGTPAASVAGLSLASCGSCGAASPLSGADDGRSELKMFHMARIWVG